MSEDDRAQSTPSPRHIAAVIGVILLLVVPSGAIVVNQLDLFGPNESIELAPADGPNGAYASIDADNELTVNITEHGVNPNAVTEIEDVFTITNRGNVSKRVWITQTNQESVTFYASDTGETITKSDNVTLLPGERISVSIRVDTTPPSISADSTLVTKLIIHVENLEPAATPRVDVPNTLDLGQVSISENATHELTIRNTGNATLSIESLSISGPNASAFTRVNDGDLPTVPAGGTATIPIRFAPESTGLHRADLALTTNASNIETATVGLRGTGTTQDISIIGGSRFEFGDVPVGDVEQTTIIIQNDGSEPVTLNQIATSNASFTVPDQPLPVTLDPGERHALIVSFAPETGGEKTSLLEVFSTATSDPLTVELAGRGLAPDIEVTPASLTYQDTGRNLTATRNVTVTNQGTVPLTITELEVAGASADMYVIDPAVPTPLTLDVNESRNITVRFTPTSAGTFSADLRIHSNDPSEDTQSVALGGTGLPPNIEVAEDHLDFGNVTVGTTKTLNITVTNPGDPASDIHLTATRLLGEDPDVFEIIGGGAPATIPPNESHQIQVRYSPQTIGIKTAQLRILSDAAEAQIDVWMSNRGWRVRVQQVDPDGEGVEGDEETWEEPAGRPDAARSELDANDVPSGVNISADVSVPSTRAESATIENVSISPAENTNEEQSFDMNFIHHRSEPPIVDGVNYTPPANETITEQFAITHSISDEELDRTTFTYSVKKSALPSDVDPANLTLRRYHNGSWNKLEPELLEETANRFVFRIRSPGFSQFVLTNPAPEDESDDGTDDESQQDTGDTQDDTQDTTQGEDTQQESTGTPVTVIEKGDTTITFPGVSDATSLEDSIVIQGLTVPPRTGNGSSGPRAAIATGEQVGGNADQLEMGNDVSLTLSENTTRRRVDLKGADALTLVDEPIRLVGTHSLFQTGAGLQTEQQMIHRVEISVPPEYRNRSANLTLRIPRERFGDTDSANATIARNNNGWQRLQTSVVEETSEYVVLQAYTPGFSEFAVFASNSVTYEWQLETEDEPRQGRQIEPEFDEVGFYNVTLTVTDAFGATDTARYVILANDRPRVSIQHPDAVAPNETVTLVANVEDEMGNVTINWTFPDGRTATGRVVEHQFQSGEQAVRVEVTDEYGEQGGTQTTVLVSDSFLAREVRTIMNTGPDWLLVLAGLFVLAVLITRLRQPLLQVLFARRKHPPDIRSVETPTLDRSQQRVIIPSIHIRDGGEDLDEIVVTILDDTGRQVGFDTGTFGGTRTYEGSNVYIRLDDGYTFQPDTEYTVRIKVTDKNGSVTTTTRSQRTDPFVYPHTSIASADLVD